MSNSVGQLLVELGINSAAFVEGMDKATYKAKQGAKAIADSFEGLGNSLSGVFGMFGQLGEQMGGVFESIGSGLSSLSGSLGSAGGAMGALTVTGVAAVAALGAVAGAATFLAAEAAEAAGKLYQLSEETGVSVENLSALSFLGKQVGLDVETMAKSLDRAARSAVKAADAADGTATPYSRLGVSVKNADGSMRDMNAILDDVVEKLSHMEKGAERTAASQEIFGRGGAKMLTALDDVGGGLEEVKKQAAAYGDLISSKTAKDAETFERTLNKVKLATDGISNTFMDALLPTLQVVADQLVAGFQAALPIIQEYLPEITGLVKGFVILGDLVMTVFKQIYDIIVGVAEQIGNVILRVFESAKAAATGNLSGIKSAWDGTWVQAKQSFTRFLDSSKKDWTDFAAFTEKAIYGATAAAKPETEKNVHRQNGSGPDKALNNLEKQVEALHAAADAEVNLAAATSQSAAAQLLTKAAGEADIFIKKLEAEAAKTTGAEHQKLTAYINANREAIEAWVAERAVAAEGIKLNQELDKETLSLARNIDALQTSARAYRQGGDAIVAAQISAALEKDNQSIAEHAEALRLLAAMPGVTADALAKEQQALIAATDKMKEHKEQEEILIGMKLDETIAKQTNALNAQAAAFELTSAAALKSAAAQREANAQAAKKSFAIQNPGASDTTLDAVYANALQLQNQQYQTTVLQVAAQNDLNKQYTDTITKLTDARNVLIAQGHDTTSINAQIYDEMQKSISQWDAQVAKVGTFGQNIRAVFNEIELQGTNMWGSIAQAGMTALNSLNTELAKLLTTGKANFKQVFQGLEQNILQSSLKKLESSATSMLFGGPSTKPDGSQSNPFYVTMGDAGSMMSGGAGGGGFGGLLGKLFGGGSSGGSGNGDFGGETDGGSGGGGGMLGGIFGHITSFFSSIFGGAMAGGGDVTPGKAYLVGEKHPEFFVPGKSGSIVPTMSTGGQHTTQLSVHFHGVTDADSFKKSQSQIASMFHRQASMAYARNSQ